MNTVPNKFTDRYESDAELVVKETSYTDTDIQNIVTAVEKATAVANTALKQNEDIDKDLVNLDKKINGLANQIEVISEDEPEDKPANPYLDKFLSPVVLAAIASAVAAVLAAWQGSISWDHAINAIKDVFIAFGAVQGVSSVAHHAKDAYVKASRIKARATMAAYRAIHGVNNG